MGDVGTQVADGVVETVVERDFGTSEEDIEAYAATAGTIAAAAACAATGAGAALASVCGYVGGEVAAVIADVCYGLFWDDEEAERARQRRIDVRAHFASAQLANDLNNVNAQSLLEALDNLRALHSDLWPNQRWESGASSNIFPGQREYFPAMFLMTTQGAPIACRQTDQGAICSLESMDQLWSELDAAGYSTGQKTEMVTERAIEIYEALRNAYNASVLRLQALAAGEWAVAYVASHPKVIDVTASSAAASHPKVIDVTASSAHSVPAHPPSASSASFPGLSGWPRWAALGGGLAILGWGVWSWARR